MEFRKEIMSDEFTKYHLLGLPFDAVIHHFTGIDKGGPHSHPFKFNSFILKGGYIERVYYYYNNGIWCTKDIFHSAGESFTINADHIHEIIGLPEGDCWTLIIPDKWEKEPRFFNFDENGISSRIWWEKEFTHVKNSFK